MLNITEKEIFICRFCIQYPNNSIAYYGTTFLSLMENKSVFITNFHVWDQINKSFMFYAICISFDP
jgi:hypothetical protein